MKTFLKIFDNYHKARDDFENSVSLWTLWYSDDTCVHNGAMEIIFKGDKYIWKTIDDEIRGLEITGYWADESVRENTQVISLINSRMRQ